jgi:hypothetical protein
MTIKLITFKTNHTLIGDVDCVSNTEITIKEPVQVVMQPTKDGPMMAFSPFLDYCDEFKTGIKISMTDVLCMTTPVRELENQYNQIFGSGIQIASAIPKI